MSTSHKNLRRTALRLASLHRDDRNWLLSQLPGAQRDGLLQLVGELDAIAAGDGTVFLDVLSACPEVSGHEDEVQTSPQQPSPEIDPALQRVIADLLEPLPAAAA